jgi:GR25 family glycosyltransferase involved in LPS biosynthesis
VPEWSESDWKEAKAWFHDHVAVFVINLPSETARWHNISSHLRDLEIEPNRVPGYDLRLERDLHAAYRDGSIPPQFNISHAEEAARSPENGMGGIRGTVGCAAAHFRAQRLATRLQQAKAITLILEDDVYVSDDFVPRVWSLVHSELPCDWEAVSLGSRCPYGKCISRHLSRVWPDVNEPEWRCRHGTNYGFQGVLYRTNAIVGLQEKWKRVVFDVKRPHCLDVDVALASISDQVGFYAVPAAQFPGFLVEKQEESVRVHINKQGGSLDSALVNAVTFRRGPGLPHLMH